MKWLTEWWRARQRRIDIEILWPSCKKQAGDNLDLARAAFAAHAYHDTAWLSLGHDEVFRIIDALS